MAGPHKGVSAAEKYAELEARGEERPRCECHGEARQWHKSTIHKPGGLWKKCIFTSRAWRGKNAERARELDRATRERIRADPILLERARAAQAIRSARHLEKIKADPALLELYRGRARDRARLNG